MSNKSFFSKNSNSILRYITNIRNLLIIFIYSVLLFLLPNYTNITNAYDITCPDTLTDQECLDYLQEEASKLNETKQKLEKEISSEQYQQLTLQQRINYLSGQVISLENNIKKIEVDIETKNVEIRILDHEIETKKNNISTLQQEINTLSEVIQKRVYYSYRHTKIGIPELLFESNNLTSLLKQIKYLEAIRKNDLKQMEFMAEKKTILKNEERELQEKQLEKEKTRQELDDSKKELFAQKYKLKKSKEEQSALYAISQQKEEEYIKQLEETKEQEKQITKKISDLIMELYRSGQLPANTPVKRGDIIGYQGHSGYSYGSHLHFSVFQNGYSTNPISQGYITANNWRVYNGTNGVSPLGNGAYITQWFHMGYALDMVGLYNQTNDQYYIDSGVACCTGAFSYLGCVPAGWYSLNGEGTPVRAIDDGMVTEVAIDPCGGKYVIVDHGNGKTSLYLHLR